jgi:hypothetical protein
MTDLELNVCGMRCDFMDNFIQHRKNALIMSRSLYKKAVLSEDFVLRGSTSYNYSSDDGKTVSYLYPKSFSATGDNGILLFSVNDTDIYFPIENPLYAYSVLYDKFCFKDGKWGVMRYFSTVLYNGTENWFKSAECTFAVDNPAGIAPTSSNNYYRWIESTITGSHYSFNSVYKYDNSIAVGTEYIAIRINNSVETVDDFKNILSSLYNNGTPLIVLYELKEPVWEVLPEHIQKYLSGFMK